MAHISNSFIQSGTIKKYFTHLHSLISYEHVELNTVVISHYHSCFNVVILCPDPSNLNTSTANIMLVDRQGKTLLFCLANQVVRRVIIPIIQNPKNHSLQTVTKLVHKIAVFKLNCIKSVEVYL
jgi:hypothetical protein